MSQRDEREKLKELLAGLSPEDCILLKERLGVDFQHSQYLDAIAGQYDVIRRRIREIEENALRKHSSGKSRPNDAN